MDDTTTSVRFLLGGVMLAGAVLYDLRERRVPNPWWIPFAWLAGVLAVGDLVHPDRSWDLLAIRYGLAIVLAALFYALWRLRLFGGADAKGLIVLSFLAPYPPGHATHALMPALDAIANGSAAVAVLPVVFLAVNAVRGDLVLPAALLGRPRDLATARHLHAWPMQVVDASAPSGLRWRFWQRLGGDLASEYHALERAGVPRIWVTPKVPFLVPVALGWLVAWTTGNGLLYLATAALT